MQLTASAVGIAIFRFWLIWDLCMGHIGRPLRSGNRTFLCRSRLTERVSTRPSMIRAVHDAFRGSRVVAKVRGGDDDAEGTAPLAPLATRAIHS